MSNQRAIKILDDIHSKLIGDADSTQSFFLDKMLQVFKQEIEVKPIAEGLFHSMTQKSKDNITSRVLCD
jgi:hypothetical protein